MGQGASLNDRILCLLARFVRGENLWLPNPLPPVPIVPKR